jgi:acyl-CoA synthetase (AMP-forming)/AMP-acid ligase II
VGRLGIKSPSVTSGYWNDSVLTHRSQLAGYWLTGDLVYKDRLGCFFHVDRTTDAIRTAEGMLYSLQTEELVLKLCPELLDCTVLGQTPKDAATAHQEPVVYAVPYRGQTVDEAALLARINQEQLRLGRPQLSRLQEVGPTDIPIGVTGKVTKQAMRQRMAETTA